MAQSNLERHMGDNLELASDIAAECDELAELAHKVTPECETQCQVNNRLRNVRALMRGCVADLSRQYRREQATKRVTLAQFRASGHGVYDVCPVIGFDDGDGPRPGRVYWNASLYIERDAQNNQWILSLARDCFESQDLAELEAKLYQFAIDEGIFDITAPFDGKALARALNSHEAE